MMKEWREAKPAKAAPVGEHKAESDYQRLHREIKVYEEILVSRPVHGIVAPCLNKGLMTRSHQQRGRSHAESSMRTTFKALSAPPLSNVPVPNVGRRKGSRQSIRTWKVWLNTPKRIWQMILCGCLSLWMIG